MNTDEARIWILESARAARQHLLTMVKGPVYYSTRRADNPLKFAIYDAERENIVAYDPTAWLGRPPTHAESNAISRALAQLEAEGAVERIGNGRTKRIRLVEGGA